MFRAIVLFWFLSFFCSAQQTTVSNYDVSHYGRDGYYCKDTYNDLDNFEGTWELNTGNVLFKIKLQKRSMLEVTDRRANKTYYLDVIVGEYLYVEDGVEIANTMLNLNNNYPTPGDYNINGDLITKPTDYGCIECGPNDILLRVSFNDVTSKNKGISVYMTLRKYDDNGSEKLKCMFHSRGMSWGEDPPCNYAIPILETYILTKVE